MHSPFSPIFAKKLAVLVYGEHGVGHHPTKTSSFRAAGLSPE
jgi:hypothetical protein